jgi:FkbM family methyltransferase
LDKLKTVIDETLGSIYFPESENVISAEIRRSGIWEPNEVEWVKVNVLPGMKCLNIGANVGYFALWMSKLVGNLGHVIAIEPNPEIIPALEKNMQAVSYSNFTIHRFACGSQDGVTELYMNQQNFGDSRVFDPRVTEVGGNYLEIGFSVIPKKVEVSVVQVDTLLKGAQVDVILIDTQGWDHEVLRGTQRTITRYHPKILTEFVPGWITSQGEDPVQILKEYQSWGYKISSPDLILSTDPSPDEICEKIDESSSFFCNLSLEYI